MQVAALVGEMLVQVIVIIAAACTVYIWAIGLVEM